MAEPFYFGHRQRSLFGMLHGANGPRQGAVLLCAPLFQDGIRSQRALWTLAEALGAAGMTALRFDWFGSGDSAGGSREVLLAGLQHDVGTARTALCGMAGVARPRLLALRSAALPLLACAAAMHEPVDVVLWDPHLLGAAVVREWRRQHAQQMHEAGRYPLGGAASASDELIGFDIAAELLDALAQLDASRLRLPAGSRVLSAVWTMTPELERFAAAQHDAGNRVEVLQFDSDDAPSFEDPNLFESLALPRRSLAQLAQRMAGSAA